MRLSSSFSLGAPPARTSLTQSCPLEATPPAEAAAFFDREQPTNGENRRRRVSPLRAAPARDTALPGGWDSGELAQVRSRCSSYDNADGLTSCRVRESVFAPFSSICCAAFPSSDCTTLTCCFPPLRVSPVDSWSKLKGEGQPSPRCFHTGTMASTTEGDCMFIFGGDLSGGGRPTNELWRYAVKGSEWRLVADASGEAPVARFK